MPVFDVDPAAGGDPIVAPPNTPSQDPPKDDLPEGLKGKSPSELAVIIKDGEERATQLEAQAVDHNERYNKLAMAALTATNTGVAPPANKPPELPDADDDPAGHQAALIASAVNDAFEKKVAPLAQQFEQSQHVSLQGAVQSRKMEMRQNSEKFPHWDAVETEVMKVLSQYAPQVAASPGAMEEVYYRELGKRAASDGGKMFTDPPSPVDSGGRGSGSMHDRDFVPQGDERLDGRGKHFAARSGMGDKEFLGYKGGGTMSLDEHIAIQAKAKTRKGAV